MKYELRYFAQLYAGFEVFSKDPNWLLPSNIACICLADFEGRENFIRLKEDYLSKKEC